jgi:O-antigen ligase
LPLARLSLDMIRDHPLLGVGLNNYAVYIGDYAGPAFTRDFIYTVHNKYLLVLAEGGPAALAAFLWFIGSALANGLRGARSPDPVVFAVAVGAAAAIAGSTLHMAVDVFNDRATVQTLCLVAGLLAALAALATAAPPGRRTA